MAETAAVLFALGRSLLPKSDYESDFESYCNCIFWFFVCAVQPLFEAHGYFHKSAVESVPCRRVNMILFFFFYFFLIFIFDCCITLCVCVFLMNLTLDLCAGSNGCGKLCVAASLSPTPRPIDLCDIHFHSRGQYNL